MKMSKKIFITILISLILYLVLFSGYIIKGFNKYSLYIDVILLLILIIIYHIKRNKIQYDKKIVINDVTLFVTMIISSIIFKYIFSYISINYMMSDSILEFNTLYGAEYDILLAIITFDSNYILITNLINLTLKKYTKLKNTVINILSIIISIFICTLFIIVFMKLM
ncbi:MAG: hypothetical protein MR938_01220 [Tenericutes bacterium]|nr:hypothetical protein [Mycoplasmatota bacterium]